MANLTDFPGDLRRDDGPLDPSSEALTTQSTAVTRSIRTLLSGGITTDNQAMEVRTIKLDHGVPVHVKLNKIPRARSAYAISVGSPDGKTRHSLALPVDVTGSSRSGSVKITASFLDVTAKNVPVTIALLPNGNSSQLTAAAPNPTSAYYYRTTTQAIPSAISTRINFDTAGYDTDGAVTTGAAWVFTVPANKGGLYVAASGVTLTPGAAAANYIGSFYRNGNELGRFGRVPIAAATIVTISGSMDIQCVPGDTIAVNVYQDAAGNQNTEAAFQSVWITIRRAAGGV